MVYVKNIIKYETADGKEFDTEAEAKKHEEEFLGRAERDYLRFIAGCYGYQELQRKGHKLTDTGVWRVEGEDPNCDMGGHHSNPFIGYFEGTLEAVIRKAVADPLFWAWGGGGRITLQKPPEVTKV